VNDNVPPVITCPGSQNRNTDTDGPGYTVSGNEFNPVSVTDNCAVTGITNSINNSSSLSGVSLPVGVTDIIWTASDASGNRTSCNFNVTVTDNVAPVVRCKDAVIYLDLNTGKVILRPADIDNGSFDNTGIASLTISTSDFDCSDVGTNNVTLTATDRYGNTGTCTSVVTVLFAVTPAASVSTGQQVICDEETTDIRLINNIPGTTWTWTAESSTWISGNSADNTGRLAQISQKLHNNDTLAHSITYNVIPRVYGLCDLPQIPVSVWVNPEPSVRLNPGNTTICNGDSTNITVRNPNTSIRGQWISELRIIPDQQISGYSSDRILTSGTIINDRLLNNDSVLRKVEYRFNPQISAESGAGCRGAEQIITIWVRPQINYRKNLSDYNGYNISCFGKSDGFVLINPFGGSSILTFSWKGPDGFESTSGDVNRLAAGQYTVKITDVNLCSVQDTVLLRAPDKLSMKIDPSVSMDGEFNINCADGATGSVTVSPVNNVGNVIYLWNDGITEGSRSNLSAGRYRIIISDANNCHADSSLRLTQPEKMNATFEVILPYCPEKPDGQIRLNVTGGIMGDDYKYQWSDSSDSKDLTNVKAGVFEVLVIDLNGCKLKSVVPVNALHELCLIIPEAISPNNDLINDVWNVGNSDLYPNIEILIFNRWGQLLWKSEEGYPMPWDGRSNGHVLPVDSYHYVIDLHNGMKPIMGAITIVK
jgi:gliding motility-associated-like protein